MSRKFTRLDFENVNNGVAQSDLNDYLQLNNSNPIPPLAEYIKCISKTDALAIAKASNGLKIKYNNPIKGFTFRKYNSGSISVNSYVIDTSTLEFLFEDKISFITGLPYVVNSLEISKCIERDINGNIINDDVIIIECSSSFYNTPVAGGDGLKIKVPGGGA